jgi:hypothetical protein
VTSLRPPEFHSTLTCFHLPSNHKPLSMPPTTRLRVPKPAAEVKVQAKTLRKREKPSKTAQEGVSNDHQAGSVEGAASKRRKVAPKEPKAIPPSRPPIDLSKTHYQPSMLPVEPQFDVQAAMNHLIQFDPRFKGLFDAMKCRPFVEPFEALDPYRTLTTSIVGQQVSSTIHDEHSSLSGQLDGS